MDRVASWTLDSRIHDHVSHLISHFSMEGRIAAIPREVAISTMAYLAQKGLIERTAAGCLNALTSTVRGRDGTYRQVQPKIRNPDATRSRGRTGKAFIDYTLPDGSKPGRVLVHHIALRAADLELTAGLDVSHLCHNGACCEASHLVLEEHDMNMSRQRCLGTVAGTMRCVHEDCGIDHPFTKLLCRHEPACIVTTRM